MTQTKPTKKAEFLSVRVSTETKGRLQEIATAEDRSLSWVVAKILERFLDDERKVRL